MGHAIDIDALLDDCADAGIVWWPKDGKLRPHFTRGRPPDALLARVSHNKDALYRALKELTDFDGDNEGDNGNDSKR